MKGDFMKVKKKCISSLKRCFILSLCVVIGLVVSLQGFCASSQIYYLKDGGVSSSWGSSVVNRFSDNTRFLAFKSSGAMLTFFCTLINANSSSSGDNILAVPDMTNRELTYHLNFRTKMYFDSAYASYFKRDSFYVSLSCILSNGETRSFRFAPSSFVWWKDNTGVTMHYDFDMPSDVVSLVSFTFGCSFISGISYRLYLAVFGITLSSQSGADRVTSAIGNDTPNTSTVDDYNKAESELMGGVQGGLNDINSQWNNINGDLVQYQGAFFAFRSFFNKLTDLPFVSVVVTLSVSVGSFALLLGAVNTIFKNRGD